MGKHWRAHFALIGMVLIWGVNFTVSKIALAQIPPLAFNAVRFPMAALLLVVMLKARGQLYLPSREEVPRVIVVGLLGNMLYQWFFIIGLDRTTAGNAALLLAGTPILTAILSSVLGHERPKMATWIGLACTFVGIVLIVTSTGASAHGSYVGDALMLGASITWAVYTVGSQPLIQRHGSMRVTAWTLWIGTIGIVLTGLPSAAGTNWSAVSIGAWAAAVYAGVLSIGLAYTIWYYGVGVLGNTRTSTYSNLTPVIAVLSAWLILGERPRALQVVGAIVIIAGVTVAQTASVRALPEG